MAVEQRHIKSSGASTGYAPFYKRRMQKSDVCYFNTTARQCFYVQQITAHETAALRRRLLVSFIDFGTN